MTRKVYKLTKIDKCTKIKFLAVTHLYQNIELKFDDLGLKLRNKVQN